MSMEQFVRAQKALSELEYGVDALQDTDLPALKAQNSSSVIRFGRIFTDTLASWIKAGFVAGPLICPIGPNFRSNQMLAVQQKDKVRIIMNLSFPSGSSFNDNVSEHLLEKVHMSTARHFGYAVIEAGKSARMWKYDLRDAYKNMPARVTDIPLQGFSWLGRFFVETQQCFGARTAVAAYDRLGNTLLLIAAFRAGVPSSKLLRCLDDVPIVAPLGSRWGHGLAIEYKSLCSAVGARLADPCPNNDKAFEDQSEGTVLGVRFNTETGSWAWATQKADLVLHTVSWAAQGQDFTLKEAQTLLGHLNDFTQTCPFLRAFRVPLNAFVASFHNDQFALRRMPTQAKADLRVWAAAISQSTRGLPIPHRPLPPAHNCIRFVSDASGAKFTRSHGHHIPIDDVAGRGVAAIGIHPNGQVWFQSILKWPANLLLHATDGVGKAYGCKTATLESVGLLLPFLCIPGLLAGKEILLEVDNAAVVYGWEKRGVRNDWSASILLRALHIISTYLGCIVHVRHLPRVSDPYSTLADHLSRTSSTTADDLATIAGAISGSIPAALTDWLRHPSEDWSLVDKLLTSVQLSFPSG